MFVVTEDGSPSKVGTCSLKSSNPGIVVSCDILLWWEGGSVHGGLGRVFYRREQVSLLSHEDRTATFIPIKEERGEPDLEWRQHDLAQ